MSIFTGSSEAALFSRGWRHSGKSRDNQAALGTAEQILAQQYDEEVLRDPAYKPFYTVGEKILEKSERMPEDWPIFSTTGYVFLNSVNGIFIDGGQAKVFDSIYEKIHPRRVNLQDVIYEKKKLVMQVAMASEVNTLGHYLNDLSEKDRHTRDFTLYSFRSAIIEVIAAFRFTGLIRITGSSPTGTARSSSSPSPGRRGTIRRSASRSSIF